MRVISKKRLREFWAAHAGAEPPLSRWHQIAELARWGNFDETRKTFPRADQVKVKSKKTVTVFDVGETGIRIVTEINYPFGRLYIRFVLVHDEYERGAWKKIL
jgi:mRNA interferase HigB